MKKKKRRTYIVDKVFQFRYVSLVAIPLIVLLSALYYLIYYSVFTQILIPEALATTLLPAMKKVNFIILCATPLIFYLLLRVTLAYSNRIIGPIPRLERELEKAIAGNYAVRLKARDNDELKSFINTINRLLERVDANNPRR